MPGVPTVTPDAILIAVDRASFPECFVIFLTCSVVALVVPAVITTACALTKSLPSNTAGITRYWTISVVTSAVSSIA